MSAPVRHLTTAELAERLGIPAGTLRWWRQRGEGPAYMKFGRVIRYRITDVEAWEQSCLVKPRGTLQVDVRQAELLVQPHH